jgi:hypothetical protein
MHLRPLVRLAAVAALASVPTASGAHFLLLEPIPTLVMNALGDPQKLGPCGGTSANAGTPTGTVTRAKGGAPLHITVRETVFHPGHYRVSLAVNSASELPSDPTATTRETARGPQSIAVPIAASPKPPVLADGLFVHTTRAAELFQTDVPIPNIACKTCLLQVTEFMAEHGVNADGGFFYHHCATLEITADTTKPMDTGWPTASAN